MATLCISALSSGEVTRRDRMVTLTRGLAEPGETVSLLLYGDGVYNLVNGSQAAVELADAPVKIYVVAEDVKNRGLTGRIIPQAQEIDYEKAVELVMEADHTITGV